MDNVAKAAFIASQCACMQARIAAMQQQNILDTKYDRPLTYQPHQFEALVDEFGLSHNAVISYFMY